MEKLFMRLLDYVNVVATVTEASLYKGITCSSVKAETEEYEISVYISKKEEVKGNGQLFQHSE